MARGGSRRSLRGLNANNTQDVDITQVDSPESGTASLGTSTKAQRSTTTRNSTGRRTRTSRITVANSSDEEDTEAIEPTETTLAPSRQLLKEVRIPIMAPKKSVVPSRPRLPVANGFMNDAESSLDSHSFDNSDYETPGTSISTTPALPLGRGRPTRKSGLSELNEPLSTSSRKRSRIVIADSEDEGGEDAMDMSLDAQLARQIQKEEYAQANKRQKSGYEDGTSFVVDDDDDDDDLSSVPSEIDDLSDEPLMTKGKGKGKAKATKKAKGKGKAKVEQRPRGTTSRRAASSKQQNGDDSDAFVSADELLSGDESVILGSSGVEYAEDDYVEDNDAEDGDNEPLMIASQRSKTDKRRRPVRAARGQRKTKTLTANERRERDNRLARFAHIEDKWERKRAMNRERAEQNHPKLLSMWDDLAKIPVLEVQKAEQPKSINRRLKPFQLEGLSWLKRQEQTAYKGGLLGDEMGMGKTIQAVSLIMSDYPVKEPTLVVVPPVALMQWTNEIREYTDGKLNVLVYHGTNAKCKKMTVKDLKKFDVIMVSYNSLESLHRKETKGWSRGDNIIKEASPLHAIHYHRLILDEAHSIKSRVTGVAKACFALKGTYKWCLSGTPVQNRIGEFFSLLRFLEVRPFADYFCRSCPCEQLHWQVDEEYLCTACGHGMSEHISVFNQELLNPITGDDPELREDALTKLHMITARIMLRRMKRDHTNSMELPMKDIVIHNEFFSAVERDFSTSIMTNTSRKFDTYVAQGVMLNNYANIFGLIMQMRQVANHPDLLLKKTAAEGSQNVFVCNICDEPAEDAIRSRCHHEFCRACVKDFMETCESSGIDADCPRCHIGLSIDFEQPELEQDEEQVKKTSIINRIKMENWTSSTKIEMLVYDLYKLRSKKQTLKSIVFSQFTSMLQLIEWRLRRAGFNTVMLDGSMTPAMRQKSIEHFMTNPDVEVFLVSLKAGGVALNLTEASRVFIVDPWWNPAAEWQSADRCHRIGQKRPCVITRLCIEDSVESRMVALQEKKAAMIAGTVNNDKVAMDRLSPEDLQFLFRGS
ncbi:hypothetical protein BU24DRAFT_443104 [Aaosphaeria arxii CBS 175.79]|uniref:Helicase SWR1 n=1 Tax=Aaosphaeria arxii CBS 175.79 TaxID=1450172 RepID=A0A6A5XIV0_9PLEO|nr:uncharacterized protein BU24DRAFT_443104 [Aaosphaeria arxii CBS 175.79]KAF2012757.1 hypothetical protein BU24DRAFT_443104 [Aaosphaeria arxii CBS 175.79]